MPRILLLLPAWLTLALALVVPARALEVQQTIWGFSGKVVPETFNPLSVLVANPGAKPFEGAVLLSPSYNFKQSGALDVQPIYLAPHTSRWVQFATYVGTNPGNYTIRWGGNQGDRYEFEAAPATGLPACVWLRDSENFLSASGAMKVFPEQLFPLSAALTDGLDAVVLDHVPSWEPVRRESFLDWLRRGGTVHLVRGPDGQFPSFGSGLEALNSTQETARFGAGRIVRHEVAAREMNLDYLASRGFPERAMEKNQNSGGVYSLDYTIFPFLSGATKPQVAWTLIHLLALAYVAVIGPLHYRYRQKLDYRLSMLLFVGVVAGFGTVFAMVGRRGYGESQMVHSLSLARSLGGGRCDVAQWVSAFATDGAVYTLTHPAPANFYAFSDLGGDGAGAGEVFNGKDGHMRVDIPLYSSRPFLHRAIMTGDDTSVTVQKWDGEGDALRALELRTAPEFPKNPGRIRALMGTTVYDLYLRDGVLKYSGNKEPASKAFSREAMGNLSHLASANTVPAGEGLKSFLPLLAARGLQIPEVFDKAIAAPIKPRADLQLVIEAPAPASFQLQGQGFTRETGWVVYLQDVFKP